jgi:hypothetical protein
MTANIDRHLAARTDADEALGLEHAEERGLRRGRELARLVEEHRAALGRLEYATMHLARPGEEDLIAFARETSVLPR